MSKHPQITLSVFTKFSGPLTKQLSLVNGKVNSDSSECRMSNGLAERITLPFDQLPQFLSSLNPMQAVATGWVTTEAATVEIITKDKFEDNNYLFPAHVTPQGVFATRTLKSIGQSGPSLVMFDHDHDEFSPHNVHTPDEFIQLLSTVVPDFDKITFLRTYSTSSSVYHAKTGECLRPADGFHIYMAVPDGADVQRFGEVLEKRLWLAGLGYIKVSARNGSSLKRTVVDTAVFSPERLIFEAGAVIVPGNPIVQRLPQPEFVEKALSFLDTTKLLDLTDDEEEAYQQAVKQAQNTDVVLASKQQVKERLTEDYIEQARRQGKILSRRSAQKMVEGLEKHILPPFHPIILSDGTQVSILELVSNPAKYDGRSCFDPLRPDKGADRAKFYANLDQAVPNPVIHSFVEGSRNFNLRESMKLLAQNITEDDGDDLREIANTFTTMNQRYVTGIQLAPGWNLVKSDKGTGKTKEIAGVLRESKMSILAVTHRVSLTHSISRDFGLACYNEAEVSASHVLRSQSRLGICYDSLHKIAGQTYDVVVLDEVTQLMRHVKSGSVKQKFICLNVLRSILLNAKYVIAMDADLAVPFVEILRDAEIGWMKPATPISVFVNSYKPAKEQKRQLRVYTQDGSKPSEVGWTLALLEHVLENGTFVATNSKTNTYDLANTIGRQLGMEPTQIISEGHFITEIKGRRVITITSDNSGDEQVANFITNLNEELRDSDILIASPSVGTGVSINAVNDQARFSRTFGRFTRRAGNTSGDCSQHLSRVRECREFDLVVMDTSEMDDVDPDIIIQKAIINKLRVIDRQVEFTDLNFCPFTRKYQFSDGSWSQWLGKLTALENLDRNEFTSNILNRLVDEGYSIEYLESKVNSAKAEEIKEGMELVIEERKAFELEQLQNATLITDEELETLETKISLSVEEKRQLKKRKTADTFGAYEHEPLAELLALPKESYNSRRNGLMFGMNGETLFVMDLVNRLDPEKQHIEKTAHFAKWNLMWQLASMVGINLGSDGLPHNTELIVTDDIRNAIYEFLFENRGDVQVLLNATVKWYKKTQLTDRYKAVGRIMSLMGLKLQRVKVAPALYVYQIDKERFNILIEDICRAKQHSPSNSFKTLVTTPKFLVSYVAQWSAGTPERLKNVHSYVSRLQPYQASVLRGFMLRMIKNHMESAECA